MKYGKRNIVAGLLFLAVFMLYGFGLIYLRDFAPNKAQWIAEYTTGTHFESRLAHVHGNLFAFLNVMVGYLILRLPISAVSAKWVSWLALAGMLMPLGIVAEFALSASPVFVLVGAIAMVAAVAWLGIAIWRAKVV
ncbi:hypothetical protein [Phaeovulum sp.]|uniref:hypothetical protein n=1 Tax=Phaeovulum sp. TaxID=2934796 RepID=UPI00356B1576